MPIGWSQSPAKLSLPLACRQYSSVPDLMSREARLEDVKEKLRLLGPTGQDAVLAWLQGEHSERSEKNPLEQASLELKRLAAEGDVAGTHALFDGLLERGQASCYHLNLVLKACRGSSVEQKALVERAEVHGVVPNVATFTMMLSLLRFEGREEEAREMLAEMERRGIEPNERTRMALSRSGEDLSKLRAAELQRLLAAGDTVGAQALFDGLLERGLANSFQLGIMLMLCSSSTEQKALVERVEARGVAPEVSTFNMILRQLRFEGREEEAREMLAEMEQRGVEPNERTRATLSRSDDILSRQRASRLQQLLAEGDAVGAQALFDGLLERGHANVFQLGIMLLNRDSSEQRALLERAEAHGLAPGVSTFNVMLSRLLLEGREEEAREIQMEMERRGIEADKHTEAALSRSEEELSKHRTAQLKRLVATGDMAGAEAFLDVLVSRMVANDYQLAAVRRGPTRSRAKRGRRGAAVPPLRKISEGSS